MQNRQNLPFYQASRDQLQEYAKRSAESRRTPELKKALADQDALKSRYKKGEWPRDLAKEYNIPVRQMYRVLTGK